jgi:hypothetical protein
MLSPDQVASQGPGGFLNLNGGPTDPYYALPDGTGYPTAAAACAAVPTAARRNRTVNVAGDDYWWRQNDLSDNGLVLKPVPGSGGTGGGSPQLGADFTFPVETDGAQSFALPAGTLGLDGPLQVSQVGDGLVNTILTVRYRLSDGNLVIDAAANLKAGDTVVGRRLYGGAPNPGGDNTGGDAGTGDINVNRLSGIVRDENLPPLTPEKVEQLTTLVNEENAQRGPFKLIPAALLDTPEDGAWEYNGVNVYFTVGTVRKLVI